MNNQTVREAPIHAMKNKTHVKNSLTCGCYSCMSVFQTSEIVEWTDDGKTAICPKCKVDSVLPQSCGIPLDTQSLQTINSHWFGKNE